ncbi:MAG: hypothetical protein VX938_09690, partial [Myxococcota bacterium]|nr:hypothetical protein [Myxococcota bacterium]
GLAGKDLARQILEVARKPRAAPRIELTITGIPNISAGERVRKAVESMEGVASLSVAQAGRGVSKLVIQTQGQESRDIALAIDGAKGLGVSVFGYSDRAIKAEYRAEAAMALQVLLGEWSSSSSRKRDAWQGKALPGVVGTSLSNLSFLRFPGGMEPQKLGDAPKAWKKPLRKLKAAPNQSLVVTGSFQREGKKVTVQTSIRAAKTGAVVLAGQRVCPADEVSGCTADLADDLSEKLLASVQEKRHLFKSGLEIQAAGADKPVRVVSVEADNIFPGRMGAYSGAAVGHLVVKNTGQETVTGVVLNADLPGYARAPVDTKAADIPAGQEARIPIRLVLDESVMAAHRDNQPAVLALTLSYLADDYRIMEKRSQAVVVY